MGAYIARLETCHVGLNPINANFGDMRIMGKRILPEIGLRFHRLQVVGIGEPFKSASRNRHTVVAKCDCGTVKTIRWDGIKSGAVMSCGCYNKEAIAKSQTKHGACKGYLIKPEYSIWQAMLARCGNPKNPQYKDYGGRGISVEWADYDSFINDVGQRPHKNLTIERRDNNLNYCKSNCYWATRAEQNKNTRASKRWKVNGVWYETAQDAADANNVGLTTILSWCDGVMRDGKWRAPKPNCSSVLKYPKTE